MTIILQQNTSEMNKIDKTLTTLATMTGTLRKSSSLLKPSIEIAGNGENMTTCNYITIPEFNRKYFVVNVTSLRENFWQIDCRVDVLTTYANEIKLQRAVIKRQENAWNMYLNDGTFKTYQNPNIVTKNFPTGFSNPSFMLAVAGG